MILLPVSALANGYDTYTAPISWAPDSSMLCAVVGTDWPQQQVTDDGIVLIYDSYGRIQFDLGSSSAGSPAYSPDGNYLALIANGQLQLYGAENYELEQTVDLEGSGLDVGFIGDMDSYALAYSVGPRFYGATLVRQLVDGTDWTQFPKPLDGDSALALRMHPVTGKWVFLLQSTREDGPAYERLYSFDNEGAPYQLTKPQRKDWDYHESNTCFMPDGDLIFQRGGWGDWYIYRLDMDSGRESLLVPDAQQPSLSADGRLLAFVRRSYADKQQKEYDWELPPGVWVRDLATGREWRISDDVSEAEHPVLSPDGKKLAWLQNMEGEPRLHVRSLIGLIGVLADPEAVSDEAVVETAGEMSLDLSADQVLPDDGSSEELHMSPKAMDISYVKFECTNGDIVFAVHHEWSPLGAAHFLELVRMGFYDGAPWFRVIDGFVAQCGISADWRMNTEWGEASFADEPVLMSNTRGMVAYGKTEEPNSRSTHIYINFGDNSRLDERGFSPFAEVIQGMEVADALFRCEFDDQDGLAAEGGLEMFRAACPTADYIQLAHVMESSQE
jgi:peptidyl-prolyl cis-trans isomerase A (cyclophilin A)